MAPKTATAEKLAPAEGESVFYVCGLVPRGGAKYSVVSGQIKNGVPELRVEPISQDLGLAAEELRAEFQRLVEFIP